jgi:hypothetical protein
MKIRRITASILGAVVLTGTSFAATQLFTAEDVDAWNKAVPQTKPTFKGRGIDAPRDVEAGPSCHSIPKTDVPSSPTIDIVSPTLDKPLAAPIDINVKFVPVGADVIQPNTFRVCYLARFMTIDITDKIAGKVAVSPQGLHVAGADLPSGHHHLMMLISDNGGHIGRREAIFDIK